MIYLLQGLGIGGGAADLPALLGYAAGFAGVPAVLTWGSLGRRAARRMTAAGSSLAQPVVGVGLAGAAAGIGLIYLVAIPAGALSIDLSDYVWFAGAGAGVGLLCGMLAGLWAAWSIYRRARPVLLAARPEARSANLANIAEMGEQRGRLSI